MHLRSLLTPVLLLIVLSAILVLGCAPAMIPEAPWEKDAAALLNHAESLYVKKQYEQAAKTVEGFFVTYPTSRHDDRARSLMGDVQFTLRNYPLALKYYMDLIERHPGSPLIIEAKYRIGLCYFEIKEYDLAIGNLSERTGITDPQKLQRIAEVLSLSYLAKDRLLPAVREFAWLAQNAPNEKQRAGYRDRVRDLIEKRLSDDDIATLAEDKTYPADLALLRRTTVLIEKRHYRDAVAAAKAFLERFAAHPEKTRAEMLLADATAKLTEPRYALGVLVPQTGQASFFGDRVLKGIQLAALSYNTEHPDSRVELIIKDTEGNPEKAVSGLAELVQKNVVAVVGPLLTREVEALAPSLAKLQVPVITPTASGTGLTELSPWIFRNALTNASQAIAAARYGMGLQFRKFVILAPDDPYGRDLTRHFSRELGKEAEILATITYPADANDFGPYIKKIIEIDMRSQKIPIPDDDQERKRLFQMYVPTFDALYLPGYADRVGLLIPQLAFYNITGKALIGSNNWHLPDLIERAGQHAEGAVFVDGFCPESPEPAVKAVVEAYRSAYQEDPDLLSSQAYDAAAMVFAALDQGKETPAAVREALLGTRDFPGVSGSTSFVGSGEAVKKLFLIKVENGKFTLLPQ
ncbi:MAG: penicillin-binding protein activator [Nitrospirota bacterium]|nr:penicillin-binding protein activator [Nitrospirota bacterium]